MPQTIALQGRIPSVDAGQIMDFGIDYKRKKSALENDRMQTELNAIKLKEAKGEHKALERFRMKAATGDEGAIDELSGYPEIQKKVFDAFDGMSPKEFMKNKKMVNEFGKAAQYIARFPQGSPERTHAWNQSIDELASKGYMKPEEAEQYKKNGPSDFLLDQALTADDYVKEYIKVKNQKKTRERIRTPEETELTKARTEEVRARTEKTRKSAGGKEADPIAHWAKGQDMLKERYKQLGLDKEVEPGEEEARAKNEADFEAYRAKIDRLFPEPPVPAAPLPLTPGNIEGKASREQQADQIGAFDNPAEIATQEQFDALPSGAYFINPATGTKRQKK